MNLKELEKTHIREDSIREMTENAFDEMLCFQNMYQAYKMAARGKRSKKEVIDFELDLSHNIWEIIRQMEDKSYRIGGYHKFMIYDPKQRETGT